MKLKTLAFVVATATLTACATVEQNNYDPAQTNTATYSNLAYVKNGVDAQKLDIYLPENVKNAPVVVFVHGGGFVSGTKSDAAQSNISDHVLVRNLLANGYAVAAVDYRTAPKNPFPAANEDVAAAVKFLQTDGAQYGIDGTRIAIMGESAGGNLSEYTATTLGKSAIKATVAFYAPADLKNVTPFRKADKTCTAEKVDEAGKLLGIDMNASVSPEELFLNAKLGTKAFNKKGDEASPLNKVSQNTPPILMFHGTGDCVVTIKHSQEYLQALQAKNVPAELVPMDGFLHADSRFYITPSITEKVLAFLKQYL